jgi:hypothetical protein
MAKDNRNIVLELTPAEAELVAVVFSDAVLWSETENGSDIWNALAKVGVYGDKRKIKYSPQFEMFVDDTTE